MDCTISVTANGRSRPLDPLIGSYEVDHLYLHTILGQIDQCMGMKAYLHSPLLDISDLLTTLHLPGFTPSSTLVCRACAFAHPVLPVNRTWPGGYFQWGNGDNLNKIAIARLSRAEAYPDLRLFTSPLRLLSLTRPLDNISRERPGARSLAQKALSCDSRCISSHRYFHYRAMQSNGHTFLGTSQAEMSEEAEAAAKELGLSVMAVKRSLREAGA
jgi:hypothetical protein